MNANAAIATPFADYDAGLTPGDDFKVFPCVPLGKTPATPHGYKDATADPAQLRAWAEENPAYNVAHCPEDSGHFVLDVDPKNGGEESLAALIAEHGPLPETYTVQTPQVGRHYWFTGSAPVSAGTRLGKGLDVRGRGGYVLLPGSRTEHGEYVEIVGGPAAPAPAWLVEKVTAPAHERKAAAAHIELDLSHNVERARAFLKAREPAREGEGGDTWTYQTAAAVMDLGCSPETTLALMQEDWNVRCAPPWEPDELASKIENANAYRQNEAGCYSLPTVAETFAVYAAALPEQAQSGPVPFSGVLRRIVSPVEEIVGGLVEKRTVTFLAGPGGSNKSRLALQWGLSIDAGLPIFGRPVERASFLYVSYEDHPDEVARRSQAIAQRLNIPADSTGQFWDLSGRDAAFAHILETGAIELQPLWNELQAHLRATPGHKFVVIDSTYNALRFAGSAKINEGAVMGAIGLMQRLCDECDATVLMLWHPSQSGQERGDASGWSVAWHNAPRARLSITPDKEVEDIYELRVEKRNHGAKGKPITLHWSNGVLLPRTEAAAGEQEASFNRAVVRVALVAAEHGAPIQMQKRVQKWQTDEIERAIGRRPTEKEIKDALASALPRGELRYLKGTNRRVAGFYPPDELKAEALAVAAKNQGTTGGGDGR